MFIHEQIHLAVSEYVKSSFKCVHAYGISDQLIKLVPAVDNSFQEEAESNISIGTVSCQFE